MTQLIGMVNSVEKRINPSLKIEGTVLTLADMRTNLARATANIINTSRYLDAECVRQSARHLPPMFPGCVSKTKLCEKSIAIKQDEI